MRRVKGKAKKTGRSLLLRICVLAFALYAAVVLIDMQITIASRRQEFQDLQQKVETQRIVNKELDRQLVRGVDEGYIDRIAREKLDYVAPDEEVYIDISGS